MSELTYTIIRLGLLALLWVFVLSLAAVLRRDIYGTRISRRGLRDRRAKAPARTPVPAGAGAAPATSGPPPARPPRRRREPVTLVVTDGQLAGTSLPLGRQGVLIGRGPECTLVLEDEFASTRHARIFPRADGWFVEDQGSRNGTTVGGVKISGAVPVESGSMIRIGRTTLELRG
ncbi:MAG: FHA domain-containing protein [Lapillicoccus sp.]